MNFLNQLRGERNRPPNALLNKQPLDLTYQQILLPKMQTTFLFFKEIISHLNFLDKAIKRSEDSQKFKDFGTLIQKDYQINTDGFGGFSDFECIKEINITFMCCGEGSFNYNLEGSKRIQEERSFLDSKNIAFKSNQFIHKQDIEAVQFTIKREIPVRFRFEANIETSKIKLIIDNHQSFNHYEQSFNPIDINDLLLNKILRFILRKDHDFIFLFPQEHSSPSEEIIKPDEDSNLFSRINLLTKWKN
jgi:hypothetical protein